MENHIKVITYNIDGLPQHLNLCELPWFLKPFAWIYKIFRKTTKIKINDNDTNNIDNISKYLLSTNADIIGVQEDFNFHDNLMHYLGEHYNSSIVKHRIDLSNIFRSIKWFPLPRFIADGISLITKKSRILVRNEEIVKWKKSYGYFTNANDKLASKGFRYYSVSLDMINSIDIIDIDIYVIHMDADFYDPKTYPDIEGDIDARKCQLQQLTNYILQKKSKNPIIIMGDTNSISKYEWDVKNIKEYLFKPINEKNDLKIEEAIPENDIDVDRLFYINNIKSQYSIELVRCYYDDPKDKNSKKLSDHKPLIIELIIKNKNENK